MLNRIEAGNTREAFRTTTLASHFDLLPFRVRRLESIEGESSHEQSPKYMPTVRRVNTHICENSKTVSVKKFVANWT